MKKRFFAALLALAMVAVLLPAAAKAVTPPTEVYDPVVFGSGGPSTPSPNVVYVGDTNVSTGYETAQTLYHGTVQYSGGVLKLDNVTVPNTASNGNAAIHASDDLIIELINTNTVTGPSSGSSSSGVYVSGSLTRAGHGHAQRHRRQRGR